MKDIFRKCLWIQIPEVNTNGLCSMFLMAAIKEIKIISNTKNSTLKKQPHLQDVADLWQLSCHKIFIDILMTKKNIWNLMIFFVLMNVSNEWFWLVDIFLSSIILWKFYFGRNHEDFYLNLIAINLFNE